MVEHHTLDDVLISKCKEEYRAWVRDMYKDMDSTHRGCIQFDGEKFYFDDDKDDLLNDSEERFIMEIRGSL